MAPYVPGADAIDCTPDKDGGVMKEILKAGEDGEGPYQSSKVFVHYVGTLAEDGSLFDSSRDRGEKFEFTLGKGEVIKAWDMGVATMKKGELARLTCKHEYAYGERGSPPKIPPESTLVFEVELFEWRGEDLSAKKDGGILRRIITQGEGYQTPNEGAKVEVKIIGRVNGVEFDNREVAFPIGEGTENNIPEGLERALERFKTKEKSLIKLQPKYGFGSAGLPEKNVPPGAELEYEVELTHFTKSKEAWEMNQEEKIEHARIYKERGTHYFKKEKYRLAVKQYKKIIDLLQYDSGLDEEKKKESFQVLLAGHLNLAQCYLNLKDNIHAKENAQKALEMDEKNVKALFRNGQALVHLDEPVEAQENFQKCLSLDPNNKAAANQLKICQAKIKENKDQEKKIYGGMFDKFAQSDAKREMNEKNRYKDAMKDENIGDWGNADADSDNKIQGLDTKSLGIEGVEMVNS
ncbi:unnamed protein product [Meganyctiphanes norvegica]|uniref:peptidylprolyl isomerase n=1 Tax=Meganyctiphanes norvegica TaxID=48144 RepID=A0AAV2REW3_MEGNR